MASKPIETTGRTPLVSVVIPSFNCAAYISRAIQSVLSQTMDDLDLIIVDDGSIDDTLSTVKPYLADRRVRYTYQNNTGLPGARNAGARLSTAPFVAFLDADDALPAEALAKMSAAVDKSGASWCVIDLLKVR